ncbi:MAG: AAA family ATPase [Bacteroidota bacterium]
MIKTLSITNYALIQQLEMSPASGLNIITGETGAGKSIMLGAVGLLLGNRADVKSLYAESEKCVVEGTFIIKDYQLRISSRKKISTTRMKPLSDVRSTHQGNPGLL